PDHERITGGQLASSIPDCVLTVVLNSTSEAEPRRTPCMPSPFLMIEHGPSSFSKMDRPANDDSWHQETRPDEKPLRDRVRLFVMRIYHFVPARS
ncbi:MAG: hypothetical protein ACREOS_12510, partial [Candidatus Dormibacteraceae bacterium]